MRRHLTQFMLADAATAVQIATADERISGRDAHDQSDVRLGHAQQLRAPAEGRLLCKRGQLRGRTMCYPNRSVPRLENTECSSACSMSWKSLKALGADEVVLEGRDLGEISAELCGARRPRLGLNAVGGASALNLQNAPRTLECS